MPFSAHWAQIFSVWPESQKRNWTLYPKYYVKWWHSSPSWEMGEGGCPHIALSESVTGTRQDPGSEAVAGFANYISNEQWDTIRVLNVWKQHLGATGVGMQNCAEDLRTVPTWSLDLVTWDFWICSTYLPSPQLLPGSLLLDFHLFHAPSSSPLRVFALPGLPVPHALSTF